MAETRVYSLLDRKLREYGALLLEKNIESMRRSLYNGLSGSGSLQEKYPDDFDLYEVGSFETETGVLVPSVPPVLVLNLSELFLPSATKAAADIGSLSDRKVV